MLFHCSFDGRGVHLSYGLGTLGLLPIILTVFLVSIPLLRPRKRAGRQMITSLVCSGRRQGTTKGEGSRNGKEPVGSKQLHHGRKREGKEKKPGRRFTAVTTSAPKRDRRLEAGSNIFREQFYRSSDWQAATCQCHQSASMGFHFLYSSSV
jgi:hypothetical protein